MSNKKATPNRAHRPVEVIEYMMHNGTKESAERIQEWLGSMGISTEYTVRQEFEGGKIVKEESVISADLYGIDRIQRFGVNVAFIRGKNEGLGEMYALQADEFEERFVDGLPGKNA